MAVGLVVINDDVAWLPAHSPILALVFTGLAALTVLQRSWLARSMFRG